MYKLVMKSLVLSLISLPLRNKQANYKKLRNITEKHHHCLKELRG